MKSLVLAFALSLTAATAAEPELRDLLRDGLYAEEVTRDAEAAARDYEKILARAEADQPFIANALFRLAELRRKQDRKEEAIKLYQRLLTRYPETDPQAKLSREALTALGGTLASPPSQEMDEEAKEMDRLRKLAQMSPDLLSKPETLSDAVKKGFTGPVSFILDHTKSDGLRSVISALNEAAKQGHLGLVKMLLHRGLNIKEGDAHFAVNNAARAGNLEIVKTLLDAGSDPDGKYRQQPPGTETPLVIAANRGDLELARLLIAKGADVNLMPQKCIGYHNPVAPAYQIFTGVGAPLHEAAYFGRQEMMDLLLENGADVNLAAPSTGATPLWFAAWQRSGSNSAIVKTLLDHGADPDSSSADLKWPEEGYPGKSTALERAILNGYVPVVKMMLEAKKAQGTPVKPLNLYDSSKGSGSLEITRLLLDYGADPNPEPLLSKSLLQWAAERRPGEFGPADPRKWELVELLMARGTCIDPEWQKAGFPGAHGSIRTKLMRKTFYPQWVENNRISAADPNAYGPPKPTSLVERTAADQQPPRLETLLIQRFKDRIPLNGTKLRLFRKINAGMSEQEIQLDGEAPFPALRWGDILETGEEVFVGKTWPPEVEEALKRRLKSETPPTN